jgi:hypothetical protein
MPFNKLVRIILRLIALSLRESLRIRSRDELHESLILR